MSNFVSSVPLCAYSVIKSVAFEYKKSTYCNLNKASNCPSAIFFGVADNTQFRKRCPKTPPRLLILPNIKEVFTTKLTLGRRNCS